MSDTSFLREILERNRYLCLGTVDGAAPWVAPLEYMLGDDLELYFFSTTDSPHSRNIESNDRVAFAVLDHEQPEYDPDATLESVGSRRSVARSASPSPRRPQRCWRAPARWAYPCRHTRSIGSGRSDAGRRGS